MRVEKKNVYLLSHYANSFKNDAGEEIQYQRAEILIPGEHSIEFKVDKECDDISLIEPMSHVDIALDISSSGRGAQVRLVSIEASKPVRS